MPSDDRALYIISVAAELAGVHPQTLRIYERKGLIEPARTVGRSRRYSDRDIALLRRIQELTNEGVGLAGVRRILELEATVDELRQRARASPPRCARRGRARAPHLPARPRPARARRSSRPAGALRRTGASELGRRARGVRSSSHSSIAVLAAA